MKNKLGSAEFVTKEVLSGITVSLALVPASVAYAIMAGVSPIVGLYSSFIVGLMAAIFGGRPGMITAATGALAVVMIDLVQSHGIEYLFAAVVFTGIIQLFAAYMRMGRYIRLVPIPAIYGFVNGLAIVIFLSQLKQFKIEVDGEMVWLSGQQLWLTLALVGLTMAIIQYFPKLTKKVPSSLVGIMFITGLVIFFPLDVITVKDSMNIKGDLPVFHWPQVPLTFETLTVIFPYAFIMAAIGLIESLITLTLVDDYTHTHGHGSRECLGQGLGNFFAGLFGGFAACATVGPTMINLSSGGRGRLSGITAALGVLALVVYADNIIELVPIPALVGLMFIVVIKTFAWATFRVIHKIPRTDAFVILAVTIITVMYDIATAVILGVIISAVVFAWENAKHIRVRIFMNNQGEKTYKVEGPLFFGSTKTFQKFFDPENDPDTVIINFKHSRIYDHSAIESIDYLVERYVSFNKTLKLLNLSSQCKELLDRASEFAEVEKEDSTELLRKGELKKD